MCNAESGSINFQTRAAVSWGGSRGREEGGFCKMQGRLRVGDGGPAPAPLQLSMAEGAMCL